MIALSAAPASAQMVTYDFSTTPNTVTAPNSASGAAIGQIASQINSSLTSSATITGTSGVTTAPGGSTAVSATNTITTNAISSSVSGNVAAPATGQLYTVNLSGMDSAGGGTAASAAFQSNSGVSLLSGVGVDSTGTSAGNTTIGATFATPLSSAASITGNVIGSTVNGNQASTLAGGNLPGAGIGSGVGANAGSIVLGPEALRQRSNTVDFSTYTITGLGSTLAYGVNGLSTDPVVLQSNGGVVAGTTYAVIPVTLATGTGTGLAGTYTTPTTTVGAYTDTNYAGGRTIELGGVIAASTVQQNSGITTGAELRAITENATVSATLNGGAATGSLALSSNAISAAANGNSGTTGIAVTGGVPSISGGLMVLNAQSNASSGTGAGAGISAANTTGSVIATLGSTVGTSTLTLDGNALQAAAMGNSAANSLTVNSAVRSNAGAAVNSGSLSTGVVLAEQRTTYNEVVNDSAGTGITPRTLETTAYTAVARDSSGVAPYNSLTMGADYGAVNVQRNRGADTMPLTIGATLADATVGVASSVATTTSTTSTFAVTNSALSAASTGNSASTNVGGTGMLLGDGATVAGLNLQESVNTSVTGANSGSYVAVDLSRATATPVMTSSVGNVSGNAISSSALVNSGTTSLTNLQADGTTAAARAGFDVAVRSTTSTAPVNLDSSYTAQNAAVSAQRIGMTSTTAGALSIADANTSGATVGINLSQATAAATSYAGAISSMLSLDENRITASSGGNSANVAVSFATGAGSTLPGGALAGNSQIIAPSEAGASITAAVSSSTVGITSTGVTAGTPSTTYIASLDSGSLSVSGNTVAGRAIANQGAGSITGASSLIAGGVGALSAVGTATLTSAVDPTLAGATASSANASYLVSNVQRVAPNGVTSLVDNTMTVSSDVSSTYIGAVAGLSSATAATSNNLVSSVAAGNVFTGSLASLQPIASASQLATSQQDVSGTQLVSSITSTEIGLSTGATGPVASGTAAGIATSALAVNGNTVRALTVMNESGLSVSGATLLDLGSAPAGNVVTAGLATNAAGASTLSLSGAVIGVANQQNVALANNANGAAAVSNTSIGINAAAGSSASSTFSVAGNTVDARTSANSATLYVAADYFGGGVGLANSQSATQSGVGTYLTASNANTTISAYSPAASSMTSPTVAVSGNSIGAVTAVNDVSQSMGLAAALPGSVGTSSGSGSSSVYASLAGASSTPVSVTAGDYVSANRQTTSGVRASAVTTNATVEVLAPLNYGTAALQSNRVYAEVTGNRLSSTQSLPSASSAYTQTASYQANNGSNFSAGVSNANVRLNTGSSGSSVTTTALLSNNSIGASAMGNVLRATVGSR